MNWGSYDIPDELKVRKKIETMLNYDIELQKNDNIYDWDMKLFRYNVKTNKKTPIGYIELEISDNWVDNYPSYWKYYSFLARKVFRYDWNQNQFTRELKENWKNTVYLISNHEMSDMICQSIEALSKLYFYHKEVTGRYYNDCFLRVRRGSKKIIRGVDNCSLFIKDFFEVQKKLDEFDLMRLGCTFSKRTDEVNP